jgi:hypothetical protein
MTLTAWLFAAACGGSAPEAQAPEQGSDGEKTESRDDGDESTPDERAGAEDAPAPKRAACDDGTCAPCGNALCPSGWYCHESAKGGPSCGWLPECAKKPTCACVKRVFSGSCEERSGGLYVSE